VLAAPRSLSLLCIQHIDGDLATQSLLDTVNADGRFAVTHCKLDGLLVMRISIGALNTDQATVDALIQVMTEASQ
jgi:hypothetical protein